MDLKPLTVISLSVRMVDKEKLTDSARNELPARVAMDRRFDGKDDSGTQWPLFASTLTPSEPLSLLQKKP
jgi:hypothetical protein